MSRRFASYWVRWSKRAAQLLRASFKRSCHGESTIQECWKRKERPWTCCRGRSTMKVMWSMMTERKWRSEPRVADGLHFGNFYPQRQVSEWDTCTRWLSFGFVFSVEQQFGFTSNWRALPLATLVLLVMDSSDLLLRYLTECDAAEISVQCAGRKVSKNDQKRLLHGLFNVPSIQECLWCSQSCMIRE